MTPRTVFQVACVVASFVAGAGPVVAAVAAEPEVRATWLTTTAGDDLSAGNVGPVLGELRAVGLNTVYVEAWKAGYTHFDSPTLSGVINRESIRPGGRDILAETAAAARANDLVHVAWFEYGLSPQFGEPSNPLATHARDNGWLLTDREGNFTNASNGSSWMNPIVPEVRQLMIGMAVDAVRTGGLDGIQFDDRLAWPVEFGYDDVTRAAYFADTGRALPSDPRDGDFTAWRQGQMTGFVRELVGALRAEDADLMISLSPSVAGFSDRNFNAAWGDWASEGLFDEVVPQAYRPTFGEFEAVWPGQVAAADGAEVLAAGVRTRGSGPATPWADVEAMLDLARMDGAGHGFWYSEGLTGFPNCLDEVAAYYDVGANGFAAHPLFVPEPAAMLVFVPGLALVRRRSGPAARGAAAHCRRESRVFARDSRGTTCRRSGRNELGGIVMKPLIALLASLLLAAPVLAEPARELRGTWMTTTANDAISSPQKTAESMRALADMGFNTVYVETWKNGYTEFPSDVMDDLIGVPLKINNTPAHLQRDLLQETLIEAHRNGLIYVAWMEYGFMAAFKDTDNELRRLAREKGWLTLTRDGQEVGEQNPFVWLNPLHPEPQQLLIDLCIEAVERYDLDGVQLDDRIAMPVEMGYDDYTKELYAAEHNGALPPDDPRDPAWVQWRADKITAYAERFAAELRAARPGLIVSVSPAPHPWSLENYACDWITPGWDGWDEFLPQCYRTSFEAFESNWRQQVEAFDRDEVLIAGIRAVGEGADTPWLDIEKKIELSGELGGGFCIWFSRAVLSVYPEQFKAFLGLRGPAINPHKPADWRPGSIDPAGEVEPGNYHVIGRASPDAPWQLLGTIKHINGPVTLDPVMVRNMAEVELLTDRR
jgi:uncharacterized lipoprotein YddW (UPF0748 family)